MAPILRPEHHRLTQKERLHSLPVPILAITGNIGSGKSTVTALLKEKYAISSLNADTLIKKLYEKEEVLEKLWKHFPSYFSPQKSLDFSKLRHIFFAPENKEKKEELEQILYSFLPKIFLEEYEKLEAPQYLFYDIPLLFEKKLNPLVDRIVLVFSSQQKLLERAKTRDNVPLDIIEQILTQQLSPEIKRPLSDFIVENEGTLEDLQNQIVSLGKFLFL